MIDPSRPAPRTPRSAARHTLWSGVVAVHGAVALWTAVQTYEGDAPDRMDVPIAAAISVATIGAAVAALSGRWWQLSSNDPAATRTGSAARQERLARLLDRTLGSVMLVLAVALVLNATTSTTPWVVHGWTAVAGVAAGAYAVPLLRRSLRPARRRSVQAEEPSRRGDS